MINVSEAESKPSIIKRKTIVQTLHFPLKNIILMPKTGDYEMGVSKPLKIFSLGGLFILLEGDSVKGFASKKVEALLVYLACRRHPQAREVLADLL